MSETLAERLAVLNQRVAAACARAGRDPSLVGLVAVSKTHGPERVAEAAAAGLRVFGENKVQEARAKIPLCPGHLVWHLVGHLQSNKVQAACELFDQIHAIDSLKLLNLVDRACDELGKTMKVLIEVNVSGEGTKYGLRPEDVPAVLQAANGLARVEVRGLMTMAPLAPDPEKARPHFRRLRELRDRWSAELGISLPELSMGMSGDFEVAVEEGASWIRVGTALFGEREAPAT